MLTPQLNLLDIIAQNLPAAVPTKDKTGKKQILPITITGVPQLPFLSSQEQPSNVPSVVINPSGQVSETEYVVKPPISKPTNAIADLLTSGFSGIPTGKHVK